MRRNSRKLGNCHFLKCHREIFLAQRESYWEAESDGQGVYSGPSTLYTVHSGLYDYEINDVPWPGYENTSTYPSKVVS